MTRVTHAVRLLLWNSTSPADFSSVMAPGGACTVEEWLARKDRYRVTARGPPVYRPRETQQCDSSLIKFYNEQVKPVIPQILGLHGILFTEARFENLRPPKEEGIDTLTIYSHDTNTHSWREAAMALLSLFDAKGADKALGHVQVEIQNPERMYCDSSRMLPDDPVVLQAVNSVQIKLGQIVQTLIPDVWTKTMYHSRVPHGAAFYVLGNPTVLVHCLPHRVCMFDKVEEAIMRVLNSTPVPLHLEFVPT